MFRVSNSDTFMNYDVIHGNGIIYIYLFFLIISVNGEECCRGYILNATTGECESKNMIMYTIIYSSSIIFDGEIF